MRDNDEWTLSLLTNRGVLYMHKHSFGARQVSRADGKAVWTAEGPDGERYAALFNTGETAAEVSVSLSELGIDGGADAKTCGPEKDAAIWKTCCNGRFRRMERLCFN